MTTVVVTVLDRNDHPPVFTRYFSARVREDAAVGTAVVHVTSVDADVGVNARHTYALLASSDVPFGIDSATGAVTVSRPLDREATAAYVLRVTTHDGVYKQETSLTVDVDDVNDNPPTFAVTRYRFDVVDGDSYVGDVSATDADAAGDNSDVFYQLTQTATAMFGIDPTNGRLTVDVNRRGVDTRDVNTYELTVMAYDRGRPPLAGRVGVTVTLRARGWRALTFDRDVYAVTVEDTATVGDTLLTLTTR